MNVRESTTTIHIYGERKREREATTRGIINSTSMYIYNNNNGGWRESRKDWSSTIKTSYNIISIKPNQIEALQTHLI